MTFCIILWQHPYLMRVFCNLQTGMVSNKAEALQRCLGCLPAFLALGLSVGRIILELLQLGTLPLGLQELLVELLAVQEVVLGVLLPFSLNLEGKGW